MKDLNKQLTEHREKLAELRKQGAALSEKLGKGENLNQDERDQFKEIEREIGEREEKCTDLQRALKVGNFKEGEDGGIDMEEKDKRNYSLQRLLNAAANPKNQRAQDAATLEFEASAEVARRMSMSPQGFYVPRDISVPNKTRQEQRDMQATVGSQGGNLVATNLMPGMIELLRNAMALDQAGITTMDGLSGDVAIPKQTGASTAYWITPEGGSPSESTPTVGQVTLSPHTIGAYTDFTRQLMLQSSIDVELFLRNELATVLGLGIDLAGIYGTGAAGQPQGLDNVTNVGSVTFSTDDNPTWAEVVELRTAVASDNALSGNQRFVTESNMVGTLMTTTKDAGSGQFIMNGENDTVMGRQVVESNQITDGDLWFGNWVMLVLGMWGGLDIIVDPYTNSTSGTVRVVALQSVDYVCRQPEAFAKGT